MSECILFHSTEGLPVLIDSEDLSLVEGLKWFVEYKQRSTGRKVARVRANSYALGKNSPVALHQLVLGRPGLIIDHINRNPLDNRKENLRLANHAGNRVNSDPHAGRKFKGPSRISRPSGDRWECRLWVNGSCLYLGTFDSEIGAAKAYDKKAKELWGEFARLNFPQPV